MRSLTEGLNGGVILRLADAADGAVVTLMLIQFAVENFLSFREETVFSMLAPPGESVGAAEVPGQPRMRVMRVAALYGANASGKSNLVEAMRVGLLLVAKGVGASGKLPARPFKLDAATAAGPCRFQFDFVVGDARYSYTIEFDAESVRAEALYQVPAEGDERVVFEREAPASDGAHAVTLGESLQQGDEEQRQFVRFIARGTRVNQPLLTEFAQRNVSADLTAVWRWFDAGVRTVKPTQDFEKLVPELSRRAELLAFCSESLARFGTGIARIEVRSRGPQDFGERLVEGIRQHLLERADDEERASIRGEQFELGSGRALDAETGVVREVLLHHEGATGAAEFTLSEESDGTRRLLHLFPVLHDATRGDHTVVVDELDRSLHTALTRRFVEEFKALADHGGARSQLIFSTHDTNLLNGRLVPPASIWFVEKDARGATHLHSLADYNAEQLGPLLERLEDGYLQGRFGAIPFLAPRASLHWAPGGSGKAA
jgi:predicted ATPase